MGIPYITEGEVGHLLDWNTMVQALADGHAAPRAQLADQLLSDGSRKMLSRAAWVSGRGVAVKSVTIFPDCSPSVQGAMLLFNEQTGAVDAVIDGALVTRWKTAADSVLGAKLLANPGAQKLLIIGAGAVAKALIEAYRAVFPDISITLWNRTQAKAEALARTSGCAVATQLQAAIEQTDILSCATMSSEPVFNGNWLRAGQHVDLIGAYTPEMREADDTAMQRARIFVDCFDTTLDDIGELRIPLASGAITRADVKGDFYDLVQGMQGRQSDKDITLFKNGGGAHLDLMIGRAILAAWQNKAPD